MIVFFQDLSELILRFAQLRDTLCEEVKDDTIGITCVHTLQIAFQVLKSNCVFKRGFFAFVMSASISFNDDEMTMNIVF